ncbi:sulfotransferase [Planctomycetales bacterium ZRK34]|nr:sulfotransferase [Planctomycetales bacterium ZRK34]
MEKSEREIKGAMPSMVVVASGRCGSSLMMQTLKLLGVDVHGFDFPSNTKLAIYANPKGFFEAPLLKKSMWMGATDGKAVKVPIRTLQRIKQPLPTKQILTIRKPAAVVSSFAKMQKSVLTPWYYISVISVLSEWIDEHADNWQPLIVDYDDFISSPEKIIDGLIEYLDISPTDEQRQAAIDNVEQTLNRSSCSWADYPIAIDSDLADAMYEAQLDEDWQQLHQLSFEAESRLAGHLRRSGEPGTELHALLSKFGIEADGDCSCMDHVREMNAKGIVWCRENIDTIVGWLEQEAANRAIVFSRTIAKQIIKLAIKRAEKKEKNSGQRNNNNST